MSKNYLTEAFKELDLLESQSFDVDKKGTSELEDFLEDDSLDDFEVVIDPEAETEEDLQKSYMGKVILMCDVCRSMIYKDPAEIVVDEESQLANVGELCPYCFTGDGYKIVGKVAPYEEVTVEAEKPIEVKVDGEEVEVEDKIEEEIQPDQKFPVEHKKAPVMEDLDLDAIEFNNPGQAVEAGLDATEELLYNPEEVDKFVEHMESKYNLEGSEITYLEDFVATTLEGDNFHTEAEKYYRGKLPIRYARDLTDADKAYVKNMLNKCKTESDFEDLLYKAINNLSLELEESLKTSPNIKKRYKKHSLKENKNNSLKENWDDEEDSDLPKETEFNISNKVHLSPNMEEQDIKDTIEDYFFTHLNMVVGDYKYKFNPAGDLIAYDVKFLGPYDERENHRMPLKIKGSNFEDYLGYWMTDYNYYTRDKDISYNLKSTPIAI